MCHPVKTTDSKCMCIDRDDDDDLKCIYELLKSQCKEKVARVIVKTNHLMESRVMSHNNCTVGSLKH